MTDRTWRIVPHVCRNCGQRVMQCVEAPELYRCSGCGATGQGDAKAICACGVKVNGKLAGWRCAPNPRKGIECPSEFVIVPCGEVPCLG